MMSLRNRLCFSAILSIFCLAIVFSDSSMEFGGFVDTIYSFQLQEDYDQTAVKTRFCPEISTYLGNAELFVNLDAVYNTLIPSKSDVELKEAYFDYQGSFFDLRLGRQIIIWGQADNVQITDIVSPKDYSEFAGVKYGDSRLAVDALMFRLLGNTISLETVWIPAYTSSRIPSDKDNPLTVEVPETIPISQFGTLPVVYTEESVPKSFLDSEVAMRASMYLPLGDFSVSGYYGWDDTAAMEYAIQPDETGGYCVSISQDYYRIWMVGLDAAVPVGAFVLRAEAALIGDRRFACDNVFENCYKKNQYLALAGIDWAPAGGWSLTAQYVEDVIAEYDNEIVRSARKNFATLSISKKLFSETLKISASSRVNFHYGDTFSSIEADYALTDAFHCTLGTDLFFAGVDDKGDFAEYEDLSSVWLRGTYSF